MTKKTRKTIEETKSGGNKKFIDLKNLSEEKLKELVKKIETGKVEGYHILKKGRKKYPRSNPNKRKTDNLDPKIKKPKSKNKI